MALKCSNDVTKIKKRPPKTKLENTYKPGLRVIGVVEEKDKTVGYLILNEQNLQYSPVTLQQIITLLNTNTLKNLKYNGTSLECTECSLNRLLKFDRNLNVTGNAGITILCMLTNSDENSNIKRFRIVNSYGRIAEATEEEILNSGIPLINAKTVNKSEGSRYISPILGTFEVYRVPKRVTQEELESYRKGKNERVRERLIITYIYDFIESLIEGRHHSTLCSPLTAYNRLYGSSLFKGSKGHRLACRILENEILPKIHIPTSEIPFCKKGVLRFSRNWEYQDPSNSRSVYFLKVQGNKRLTDLPDSQIMFLIPEVRNFLNKNLDIPIHGSQSLKKNPKTLQDLLADINNLVSYQLVSYEGSTTLRELISDNSYLEGLYKTGKMLPKLADWYATVLNGKWRQNDFGSYVKTKEGSILKVRVNSNCTFTEDMFRKPENANHIGLTLVRSQDRVFMPEYKLELKFVGRNIINFDRYYPYSNCLGDLCAVADATIALQYEKWEEAEIISAFMGIYNPKLAKFFIDSISDITYWGNPSDWKYGKANPEDIVKHVKTFLPNFDFKSSHSNMAPHGKVYYESGFNVFYGQNGLESFRHFKDSGRNPYRRGLLNRSLVENELNPMISEVISENVDRERLCITICSLAFI